MVHLNRTEDRAVLRSSWIQHLFPTPDASSLAPPQEITSPTKEIIINYRPRGNIATKAPCHFTISLLVKAWINIVSVLSKTLVETWCWHLYRLSVFKRDMSQLKTDRYLHRHVTKMSIVNRFPQVKVLLDQQVSHSIFEKGVEEVRKTDKIRWFYRVFVARIVFEITIT